MPKIEMINSAYLTKQKVFEKNTRSLSLSLNIDNSFCAKNFYKNTTSNLSAEFGLYLDNFLRIHCEVLC
jgi:hypothetical protein